MEGGPKFEKKASVPSVEQTKSLEGQNEKEVAEVVERALNDTSHPFSEEKIEKEVNESFFHRTMDKIEKTVLGSPQHDPETEAWLQKSKEELDVYRPLAALREYYKAGEINEDTFKKAYQIVKEKIQTELQSKGNQ